MPNMSIVIAPVVSFLIGLGAVSAARRIALLCRFIDNPDACRKFHSTPIALGGGIAVWLAAWSGWGISQFGGSPDLGGPAAASRFCVALGLTSFLMLGLGVVDDRVGLRARYKLAGQFVVAIVLFVLGIRIDAWRCFGFEFALGILAGPTTVIWVLLVVNAFNLIDGMDGFCASQGLIATLAIGFVAYRSGHADGAGIALALAGSLAAFLRFNLPPAKIFLGDAGSMTTGLMISALAVRSCGQGPRNAVLLMPVIALLIVPLFDVFTAVCRRWLSGRSLFAPDRGHIHHCMKHRLQSEVAALWMAVFLAVLGAGGVVLEKTHATGDLVASLCIGFSVGLLICTNTFAAAESRLLLIRLKSARVLFSAAFGRPGGMTGLSGQFERRESPHHERMEKVDERVQGGVGPEADAGKTGELIPTVNFSVNSAIT